MKFSAYPNVYKALVFLAVENNSSLLNPEIPAGWEGMVDLAEAELRMFNNTEIEAMACQGEHMDKCINAYHLLQACMEADNGLRVFD